MEAAEVAGQAVGQQQQQQQQQLHSDYPQQNQLLPLPSACQ